MTLLVRRISESDGAPLRDIRLRALKTDPHAFGSTYAREAARGTEGWNTWAAEHAFGSEKATFFALRDDLAVGVVAVMREHERAFGLFSMWVAPEARRDKIGKRLVEHAIAWVRAEDGTALNLLVTQPTAIAFYASCGFRDDGRRKPYPHSPALTEVGMTLRIS